VGQELYRALALVNIQTLLAGTGLVMFPGMQCKNLKQNHSLHQACLEVSIQHLVKVASEMSQNQNGTGTAMSQETANHNQ